MDDACEVMPAVRVTGPHGVCFGEDGITQGLPNVERGIGALSAALVPELGCADSEQQMKIKPQTKLFVAKKSTAQEPQCLRTPLAWHGRLLPGRGRA